MAHNHGVKYDRSHNITLWQLFKRFLASKIPNDKRPAFLIDDNAVPPPPSNVQINNLAIVVDGVVEETLRAKNKLTAMLLSEPVFVEYDPSITNIVLGVTKFDGKEFTTEDNHVKTD